MRKVLQVTGASLAMPALLVWSWRALGPASAGFSFCVVWLPMAWLGTLGRVVTPRLPARIHALQPWERDGRIYERLGVRAWKALLRRGPLAAFNPHLHLPAERTPADLARLEDHMLTAEASHALLLVATAPVIVHAGVRGWWAAAGWTLLFDVLVNGYPVMLQRYNRALLHRRFTW